MIKESNNPSEVSQILGTPSLPSEKYMKDSYTSNGSSLAQTEEISSSIQDLSGSKQGSNQFSILNK